MPRLSATIIAVFIALCAWAIAIAYPLVAVVSKLFNEAPAHAAVQSRGITNLLLTTLSWGAAVAFGSALVGWLPGVVLGKAMSNRGGRGVPIAALILVPLCLPAYVIFFAWWQSWPPDTAIFRWVIEHQQMQHARDVTLFLGLMCWSWPLVSLCVAGGAASGAWQRQHEMLRLDGAGVMTRWSHIFRRDRAGLALGALLVFLVTINNTTSFDLAEVFTFANDLRAISGYGASTRQTLIAAWPVIAIAALGAAAVWRTLGKPRTTHAAAAPGSSSPAATIAAIVIWSAAVLLPIALFTANVARSESNLAGFWRFYGASALITLGLAAVSGLLAGAITLALTAVWHDERPAIRGAGNVLAVTWLFAAIVPGTIVGLGLEAAYNRGALSAMMYSQPIILIVAHLTCFGFVCALLARWAARAEPRQLADLRRLDDAQGPRWFFIACRPRLIAASIASTVIVFALAIGEIPVTAAINPPHRPGYGPLAMTILNDMHYQRPQTVMIAALGMLGGAVIAAIAMALVWRRLANFGFWILDFGLTSKAEAQNPKSKIQNPKSLLLCVLCASALNWGCTPDDPENPVPLKPVLMFGSPGQSLGQFGYPRAIAVDPTNKLAYVIDKSARVQRFGLDGEPQLEWRLPEKENGKPTGVSVRQSDGAVFVADTHYFRVIAYDKNGKELLRFGEYGRGPGQFIYVTDIAFGPQGRLYVAEYGGNDRVQVFSSEGVYLFEFGSFGGEPGQFNRPQALAFNADLSELFIADACNHRIVVTDPKGNWLRTLGAPGGGRGPGQMHFPYSVMVLPDRSILVCEYGNNRIQRLTAEGKSLGFFGKVGRAPGELQYPWAIAGTENEIFVLDSGNNRVQVIRTMKR